MSVIYTRTIAEGPKTVHREQEVIVSPGRVSVRKYRDGQSQPGYGQDVRTRFPNLTAWRVGRVLRRDGYTRRAS
jgi:hypothetical protein